MKHFVKNLLVFVFALVSLLSVLSFSACSSDDADWEYFKDGKIAVKYSLEAVDVSEYYKNGTYSSDLVDIFYWGDYAILIDVAIKNNSTIFYTYLKVSFNFDESENESTIGSSIVICQFSPNETRTANLCYGMTCDSVPQLCKVIISPIAWIE